MEERGKPQENSRFSLQINRKKVQPLSQEAAPFFTITILRFLFQIHQKKIIIYGFYTPKQDYWAQRYYMVLFLIINNVNLLVFPNKCRNFAFHKICNIKHGTTEQSFRHLWIQRCRILLRQKGSSCINTMASILFTTVSLLFGLGIFNITRCSPDCRGCTFCYML